jgi:hypothetical protein
MTISPLRASRLPVGSSARITRGERARARAMATRCRSPPESWAGMCRAREARPTGVQVLRDRLSPLASRHRQRGERGLDVLRGGQGRDQVELLEDEAQRVQSEIGERGVSEPFQRLAFEVDRAASRPIKGAEELKERGLPGARWSEDGDELPLA